MKASSDSGPPARLSFSMGGRLRSFRHAFRGLKFLLVSQHNAWIHLMATIVVVALGGYCRLSREEWCWITVAVVMVWLAEAFNTALECLADEVSTAHRELIGRAKDLGAAAVLLAGLGAAIIGLLVFVPHLQTLAG